MSFCGALAFAILTRYSVAIVSLFIIGIGMAMLQVALNPLLRVAGGEEHFAFNSTVGAISIRIGLIPQSTSLHLPG